MASVSKILREIPSNLIGIAEPSELDPTLSHEVWKLGISELDHALPGGGLLRGAVTEFSVFGGGAGGTALSLLTCRAAWKDSQTFPGSEAWCAFVDPGGCLHAPGLARLKVDLEHLLVVRPDPDALLRTTLRLVESKCFTVIVVDTMGCMGRRVTTQLGSWLKPIRRISSLLEGTNSSLLLITDAMQPRPLPLPVATRVELRASRQSGITLQTVKDKYGRLSRPHKLQWPNETEEESGVFELDCVQPGFPNLARSA